MNVLSIKGKNILVTGGAGFIGSHLCDALLQAGAGKVVCVDNFFLGKEENLREAAKKENFVFYRDDASKFGVMYAITTKEEIDIVYNLATIALNYSFFNPFDAYMVNVELAQTMLELLKAGTYRTLIHMSSSEAYGTAQYSPMDENHPMHPTTPYAAGKAAADLMIQSFYNVEHLDTAILRSFNNYGPRQNAEGPLAGIIPKTARRIRQGEKPILQGDGLQTRDFIYVEDTVRALLLTYEREESRGQIINIGSGEGIAIRDLLDRICAYMGYQGEWEMEQARNSDVHDLCASSALARKLLGFAPKVAFDEGIRRTLDWYLGQG
jgi:UDP-glucose 4-epimerase